MSRKPVTPKAPPKIPALKPLARGGYGATVRAGRYPDDFSDESKRGTEIQFRLRLVTKERVPGDASAIPERVQHCYERLLTMRDRLVAAHRGLEAEQLMRDAALRIDEPELFETALSVAEMVTTLAPAVERSEWTTWGDVADAWTTGALSRRFPSKQIKSDKASKKKDEGIIAWLKPFIGNVPLETFNHEHYDRAMGNLPAGVKADSAKRHYATVIMRVMRLARKCRLVTAWHLDDVEPWRVEKKDRKVFTCLFPSDVDKLLSCPELEYRWRVFWGFMIFESPRVGYLPTVRWRHVETDGTGGIGMDSKSGEWLSWDLRPGTLEALLKMRELYPELEGPFAWIDPDSMRLAETLREHLAIAGCLDARLHENDGRRRRMRAHDLRATFVVFAKIEGHDEQWIMDRTGHTSSEMVQRYDRMERKARGKGWRPLGRLDEALRLRLGPDGAPELAAGAAPRALLTEGQADHSTLAGGSPEQTVSHGAESSILTEGEGDELAGGEEMSDDEVEEVEAYCERVRGEVLDRAAADRSGLVAEGTAIVLPAPTGPAATRVVRHYVDARGVVLDVPGHDVRLVELGPDERVGGPSGDGVKGDEPNATRSLTSAGGSARGGAPRGADGRPIVVVEELEIAGECVDGTRRYMARPGAGHRLEGPPDDDGGGAPVPAPGRAAPPVPAPGAGVESDSGAAEAPDGCVDEGNTHTVTDTVTKAVTVSYSNRVGGQAKRGHMRGKTRGYGMVPAPGFEPESRDSKTRDRRPERAKSADFEGRDELEATGNDNPSRPPVTHEEPSRAAPVTPRAAYGAALKRAMVAAIEAEALDDLPDLARLFEAAKSAAGGAKVVELALRRTGG